ncbi:carbohydrate kinase family protein [Candidatus Curtissbacteria bacterium]|nr:carbohydrate kinase family protein [Candidatus Curtissbacteria bacterium]
MNDTSAQFDIITIGDSTVDTSIKIHDASVQCNFNNENCKICLSFGDKIPVDAIGHSVAGNAANVVVGCAKLGLTSAIYTNLGGDSTAQLIKNAFDEAGVSSDYISEQKDKESNLSVIINFQNERTAMVYHQKWQYRLPVLADSSFVYYTSVSESFTESNIVNDVCNYLDKSNAKLVYGPGTYQLKADVKKYPRLLEKTEVFIINLEEAKKILGVDVAQEIAPKELLNKIHLLGPKNVVITDGEEGSYFTDGSVFLRLGILPVNVYEKTGAGDAYSSAFVSALCLGHDMKEAMVWGALNSASCIQKLGPQNGLLTLQELERNRKIASDLVASEF